MEKNTNKPIVLVTFAFLKLRVWMQNVWLTYLEVLIRIGRSGDWTMSRNTQVLSISLLCQTQRRLQLKVVFPVVIGRLHVSLRALSFSFHVSRRGKWRGTGEGDTDTFPSHWTEAFFSVCLDQRMSFTLNLTYMECCALSEFLNQLLIKGRRAIIDWD